MAEKIKSLINKKYGIDIDRENILKLYHADKKKELTQAELEKCIADTRKRWQQSINGANEKNAARDRARLEKADKYEAILRDSKLREALFDYYNGNKGSGEGDSADSGMLAFAKEYFGLVATTKTLDRNDAAFFCKYYDIRKNALKESIYNMLRSDFKVKNLDFGPGKSEERKEEETQKKHKGGRIVNLFDEGTILLIRKCLDQCEKAAQTSALTLRFIGIRQGLFNYLELERIDTAEKLRNELAESLEKAKELSREKGAEFNPLRELLNSLLKLSDCKDVQDNFEAFKLLIKYPDLTPYMFAFVEMKEETLNGMTKVACRDYAADFNDMPEFIVKYYLPVRSNFGISDAAVASVLKAAQKAGSRAENAVLKLFSFRKGCKLDGAGELLYLFAYWPVYLVYLLFEVFRLLFTSLAGKKKPMFYIMLVPSCYIYPFLKNFLKDILFPRQLTYANWCGFLENFLGFVDIKSVPEAVIVTLVVVTIMVSLYYITALFLSGLICNSAAEINKQFDWIGYQRTFESMFQEQRIAIKTSPGTAKGKYIIGCMVRGVINMALLIIVILCARNFLI